MGLNLPGAGFFMFIFFLAGFGLWKVGELVWWVISTFAAGLAA